MRLPRLFDRRESFAALEAAKDGTQKLFERAQAHLLAAYLYEARCITSHWKILQEQAQQPLSEAGFLS